MALKRNNLDDSPVQRRPLSRAYTTSQCCAKESATLSLTADF